MNSEVLRLIGLIASPVVSFVLGWLVTKYRSMRRQKDQMEKQQELVNKGIIYLLRSAIKEDYMYYMEQGYCSLEDKEEFDEAFQVYTQLGGNHTVPRMHRSVMNLPDFPSKEVVG